MEIKYWENQNVIFWWDMETDNMRVEFKPNCDKKVKKMYKQLTKEVIKMLDKNALDEYLTQTPEEYYGRKDVEMCENCHGSIYDGEEYYDINGTIICEECMDGFKKIAGEY